MTWAKRTDSNHQEVKDALEQLGWTMLDLSRLGKGAPDFLAARGHVLRLIEVKGKRGTLTPAQEQFHRRFDVRVIRTIQDCERLR